MAGQINSISANSTLYMLSMDEWWNSNKPNHRQKYFKTVPQSHSITSAHSDLTGRISDHWRCEQHQFPFHKFKWHQFLLIWTKSTIIPIHNSPLNIHNRSWDWSTQPQKVRWQFWQPHLLAASHNVGLTAQKTSDFPARNLPRNFSKIFQTCRNHPSVSCLYHKPAQVRLATAPMW